MRVEGSVRGRCFDEDRPEPVEDQKPSCDIDQRRDFDQGSTSACGPTALAIVFHSLGIDIERAAIDREIRPTDVGTRGQALVDYAEDVGFQAKQYNHGSFEALEQATQAGHRMLAETDATLSGNKLVPGNPNDMGTHWVVVDRAYRDPETGERMVQVQSWGKVCVMPYRDFEKLWSNLSTGVPTGHDRAYVLVDRPDAPRLPTSTSVASLLPHEATQAVLSDTVRGVHAFGKGDIAKGSVLVVAAVALESTPAAVGWVLDKPAQLFRHASNACFDALAKSKNVVRSAVLAVVGGLAKGIEHVFGVVAGLFSGFASAISAGAGAISRAVSSDLASHQGLSRLRKDDVQHESPRARRRPTAVVPPSPSLAAARLPDVVDAPEYDGRSHPRRRRA